VAAVILVILDHSFILRVIIPEMQSPKNIKFWASIIANLMEFETLSQRVYKPPTEPY
jgi:hypothetical protein